MKHALLFICIPWIVYSCDEIETELPLHAINGVAFVASKDTTIYTRATEVDTTYHFYDECLDLPFTYPDEKEP